MIETGYEGGPPVDDGDPVTFELEAYQNQYTSSGVLGRVKRNGEWIGLLRLRSEDEFEWLKGRISGTYNQEEEENDRDTKVPNRVS